MEETNFETIKREVKELMDMPDCPDAAKEILTFMMRDKESLSMFAKVVSVLAAHSETFSHMIIYAITILETRVKVISETETVN